MPAIDLNCDMGESFGRWDVGVDATVMPLVSSANIACGLHAGDPGIIRATIALARQHDVAVGAHPGYPDLQGFGRRAMDLTPGEVEDSVLYQIGAVYAFARSAGVELMHVKPHGALYNRAARDPVIAEAVARAIARFDADLIMVALAGSSMVSAAREQGLVVAQEGFADRVYEPDGSLRPRSLPGAVLDEPGSILAQAISIAQDRRVVAGDGQTVPVHADTICLHGDTPAAASLAATLREGLLRAGAEIRPLRELLSRQPAA